MTSPNWEKWLRAIDKFQDQRPEEVWSADNLPPLEIVHGVIHPPLCTGIRQIEAQTAQGWSSYFAFDWKDWEALNSQRDAVIAAFDRPVSNRKYGRIAAIAIKGRIERLESQSPPDLLDDPEQHPSPDDVLIRLRDRNIPRAVRRRAVLDAEITTFSPTEISEVVLLLREYALQNRDSQDPEDVVAATAAIRKIVAYLPSSNLGSVAELLDPGHRLPIALDIELEVAKVVVRKLLAIPPRADDTEPALADRLFDLVQTYVRPRLVAREKHGATALNAALGIFLLRSARTKDVVCSIRATNVGWFSALVSHRAKSLTGELQRRFQLDDFLKYSKDLSFALEQLSA